MSEAQNKPVGGNELIVGVTGFFAAGKDSCAEHLERRGFRHISLSDIIREELTSRGLEITIPNLTAVGNELRQRHGSGVLGRRALERIVAGERTIVTSIRHPDEVRELQSAGGRFALLFVDAPLERRFARSRLRARPGDPETLAEFTAAERTQLAGADPAAQQLAACRELARCVLNNDGSLEEFHQRIDAALAEFGATAGQSSAGKYSK